MPTYRKRRSRSGTVSVLAQVRVRPFKAVNKTFSRLVDARRWAESLHAELIKQRDVHGQDDSATTSRTIAALIAEYLRDPATCSLRSFIDRRDRLAWWVNFFGSLKVIELTVRRLREARARLIPGREPATVNRYLASMRACWNWGRANGLVPRDAFWPPRLSLAEPPGRVRFLAEHELSAVLASLDNFSPAFRAAVIVSLATGLRQGELLNLRWGDLDIRSNRLLVREAKNGEARAVFLPGAAVDAIEVLAPPGARDDGAPVFVENEAPLDVNALTVRWRKLRSACGLQDFRWHDLRHSCASYLAQNGATLLEIGSVLGHKSPSITKRYAHLVQGAPVTGHDGLNQRLRGGAGRS